MFTYLILNIVTIAVPLARSFEHRIAFYKKFVSLFLSIAITAAAFLIWDHFFTISGIWSFNPEYLVGIYWFNLPIEEWMFFFTVPFACVFIYEVLNYFFKNDPFPKIVKPLTITLIAVFALIAIFNLDRLYTAITFSAAAVLLALQLLIKAPYLGKFFRTYFVHLIPFLIINGFLTALPVVIYNNTENLGIRIGTIPVEDTVYSMVLLLMNITLYEHFNKYIQAKA